MSNKVKEIEAYFKKTHTIAGKMTAMLFGHRYDVEKICVGDGDFDVNVRYDYSGGYDCDSFSFPISLILSDDTEKAINEAVADIKETARLLEVKKEEERVKKKQEAEKMAVQKERIEFERLKLKYGQHLSV